MPIEWRRHRFEIAIVSALIIGLWLMFYWRVREVRRGDSCQSNLKQVGNAINQYIRNYDEKYPPGRNWNEVLIPYTIQKNDVIFHCPSAQHDGYALNAQIGILSFGRFDDPPSIPLVFESSILKTAQHDNGKTWLSQSRHPQVTALVYMDGHAQWRTNPPQFKPVLIPKSHMQ